MRLKEDKTSWRASGLIRKIKPLPEDVRTRSHKNTAKWCKGKVGREHVWKRENPTEGMFPRVSKTEVTVNICQVCRKQAYSTVLWNGKSWEEHFFGKSST